MKIKCLIGICCLFMVIPLFINFLSVIPAPFKSWENPSTWTSFWGQYLSGFASIAMLYVAWKSLVEAREVNRPFIIVDLVEKKGTLYIRCRNIGHSTAFNIKLRLEESFIRKFQIGKVKDALSFINKQAEFILEPNGKKLFELSMIPCSYNDMMHKFQWETEASYPFKGEKFLKSLWIDNEKIFIENTIHCTVEYNNYSEKFILDYNNREEDIEPAKYISDYLMSISLNLSNVKDEIKALKEKINGTEQNK